MNTQSTLFELPQSAYVPRPQATPVLDVEALAALAFCYTATAKGNSSGIRFACPVEDAQAWCESDLSRGTLHGTAWVYMWTRVTTFLDVFPPPLDITGYVDNGEWDGRLASVGVRKISLTEFAGTFGPFGLEVIAGDAA